MRRHRPTHYSLAFLTVALGIAVVPAAVRAEDRGDPVAPADADSRPAQPAPPAADEIAPPTTQAPPPPVTTASPATTPPESAASQPAEHTSATPRPEVVAAPGDETSATPPTTPASAPASAPALEPVDTPVARRRVALAPADHDDDDTDTGEPAALPAVGAVRAIAFPVLGAVRYGNDWGTCRDGCARRHEGIDMVGVRMQPLLAAVDGTVTRIRYDNVGTAGSVIAITGTDGWYYNYFHVNNDTPGTDDGRAGPEWQISPQLTVGSTVRAGQVIGYMGDSGNAESSVPHLHFEIRQPDRTPVNPYHGLVAAQERETCEPSGGLTLTDPRELSPAAVAVVPLDGGGHWLIDLDGRLFADGAASRTVPARGVDCSVVTAPLGTRASASRLVSRAAAATAPSNPVAPSPSTWTVERGESLWEIVQEAYGVSATAATASLVDDVLDHNRDVIGDPAMLRIGTTLRLPPRA
jgi:murein DD-endopeptidase MepM/ murein hydrolase activator NlpD